MDGNKAPTHNKKLNTSFTIEKKKQILNYAILQTLNLIGSKGGFHFSNLLQTIENDLIPKFVFNYFSISSIKNVEIKPNTKKEDIIKNIEYVIDYLKKKEVAFEILRFDFKDPTIIESSVSLFFMNFFYSFFVKKDELLIRIKKLFYIKDNIDLISFLGSYNIYIRLVCFLNNEEISDTFYDDKFTYKKVCFHGA